MGKGTDARPPSFASPTHLPALLEAAHGGRGRSSACDASSCAANAHTRRMVVCEESADLEGFNAREYLLIRLSEPFRGFVAQASGRGAAGEWAGGRQALATHSTRHPLHPQVMHLRRYEVVGCWAEGHTTFVRVLTSPDPAAWVSARTPLPLARAPAP